MPRVLRSMVRMNLLSMKLWRRKKVVVLGLLSHLKLQSCGHGEWFTKLERALHLWVEDTNRKCAPGDFRWMAARCARKRCACERVQQGTQPLRWVTPSHLLQVRDSYMGTGVDWKTEKLLEAGRPHPRSFSYGISFCLFCCGYSLLLVLICKWNVIMNRKSRGICRVRYDPWFQASSEGLGTYPLWAREDYCMHHFKKKQQKELFLKGK